MPTHRVGTAPSVEEALQKLTGADIAASPADSSFEEVSKQLYAVEAPPRERLDPARPDEAEASMPAPTRSSEPEAASVIENLQADAVSAPAAKSVDAVTTAQLLDTIRSSSQSAVRRLAAVAPPGAPSRLPATSGQSAPLPGISDLSREVERAVASAVAAAGYHHDVEQRATSMASTTVADAAVEAERALERAGSERDEMLAGARSETKQLLSDGKAQRDAIIARAEARAEGIVEQAEVELARRVRHIADTAGAIADIADAALGRLAAGSLTGEQLAQFVTALGAATERIIAQSGNKEQ